jgi:RNA polymerase sigma factor (sigma-70 family)
MRPLHFARLLRFLRRKGRSREDAEDLIQEAMLRLHIFGQAAAVENEAAFLQRTVNNLSIDQYRREQTSTRGSAALEVVLERSSTGCHVSSIPEEALDAEQRIRQLRITLDAVSRRTRDIYFAHRAGYSYAEIAAWLDISHMTIKRHITRALLAIMEQEGGAWVRQTRD